jgi:hypothetical protein
MIFDKELMYADKEKITSATAVTFKTLDMGTQRPFSVRTVFLGLEADGEVTATGDPDIEFVLEVAETDSFANSKEFPMFGVLKKGDFANLRPMTWPMPPSAKARFSRLKMTSSAAIACGKLSAGIVLDAVDPVTVE